jgi:hypothetical protein
MSKGTNQQLTLLAAVSGALAVMGDIGKVSQVDRRRFINKAKEELDEVIAMWDASGDDLTNFVTKIQPAILDWHEFLQGQKRITLSPVNLACMCARVIQDQLSRCSNRRKLYMLGEVAKNIEVIHGYFDPEAENFVAFDESSFLMDYLYHKVEWDFDWENKKKPGTA